MKLTVIPPTRGMFGTATHLTHIADLPLLDYNTWDISRATVGLKRVFDVAAAVIGLVLLSPVFLLVGLAIVSSFVLHIGFFGLVRALTTPAKGARMTVLSSCFCALASRARASAA